jgi:translation elongation factor EF-1alpha
VKLALKSHLFNAFFFRGDAFIPFIDKLPSLNRKMGGPFVMPVVDKYKDMGMVVMGKVEAGEAKKGQSLLLMPNRVSDILSVYVFYQSQIGKKCIFCLHISCTEFVKSSKYST